MENSCVTLIGMPGAGKSTLGVVLAKIMGLDFLDGDLLIQKQQNLTLPRIIDDFGVDGFIEIENQVLREVDAKRCVIATGGSAVYSDEAMKHLATLGPIVYLRVSLDELEVRLGGLHERGVVMKGSNVTSLADLFEERAPLYEQYADIIFDIDGMSVRDAAVKLVRMLSLD